MFEFLIGLSSPAEGERLKERMQKAFRHSGFTVADGTTQDAEQWIKDFHSKGDFFDAAILDEKLLDRETENSYITPGIFELLNETMPRCLVVHVYASSSSEDFLASSMDDLHSYHRHPMFDNPGEFINRESEETDWMEALNRVAATYLYGSRIRKLRDIFLRRDKLACLAIEEMCVPNILEVLSSDILYSWKYLDERLRREIKADFMVDELSDPMRVTFILGKTD